MSRGKVVAPAQAGWLQAAACQSPPAVLETRPGNYLLKFAFMCIEMINNLCPFLLRFLQ